MYLYFVMNHCDPERTQTYGEVTLVSCKYFFRCLSNQSPPLFGDRSKICKGELPKTSEQLVESVERTRTNWIIYLVVAIFVTMFLTIIATFVVVKFFCM